MLLCLLACAHSGPVGSGEIMYVSAPEANLRDRVAAVHSLRTLLAPMLSPDAQARLSESPTIEPGRA